MFGVKFREHDKNETLLALGMAWQEGEADFSNKAFNTELSHW